MFSQKKYVSMFKPKSIFVPATVEEPEYDDEEMIVTPIKKPSRAWLPGEKLLKKINKQRRVDRGTHPRNEEIDIEQITRSMNNIIDGF